MRSKSRCLGNARKTRKPTKRWGREVGSPSALIRHGRRLKAEQEAVHLFLHRVSCAPPSAMPTRRLLADVRLSPHATAARPVSLAAALSSRLPLTRKVLSAKSSSLLVVFHTVSDMGHRLSSPPPDPSSSSCERPRPVVSLPRSLRSLPCTTGRRSSTRRPALRTTPVRPLKFIFLSFYAI